MWKVCHNAISTKEALHKKRLTQDPMCPICKSSPETTEHLLLLCPWTEPLWFALNWFPPPSGLGLSTIHPLDYWYSYYIQPWFSIVWLFFSLWIIWKARNDVVFNGKTPNPMDVFYQIKTQCHEFLSCWSPINLGCQDTQKFPKVKVWRPHRLPYLKINSDAAFNSTNGRGYSGIICRDEKGYILTTTCKEFLASCMWSLSQTTRSYLSSAEETYSERN